MSETEIFVVTKVGVYGHGVIAVSSSLHGATELAEVAAAAEEDDYHDFVITKHEMGFFSEGQPVGKVYGHVQRSES